MAYGITSQSQLLDIATVTAGCKAYEETLKNFVEAGKQIIEAGDICDKKALSVDNASMQPTLHELGQLVADVSNTYLVKLEEVLANAVNVYNAQVAELQAYYQWLEAERAKKNSGN